MPKKNKGPDLDMYLEGKRDRYVTLFIMQVRVKKQDITFLMVQKQSRVSEKFHLIKKYLKLF